MADVAGNNFDIVILGGGSGGYACALRAVQLGKSVALIEKSKLGGTCLHWGCIPTKAMLHAAEVADGAREGAKFGVKSTFEGIDMAAVNSYKDGVIDRLYKGLQGLIKSGGITVVEGEGKLVDPKTVEVNGERYTGTNVVLATGSVSRTLGLEIGGRVITSTEALKMSEVPERVVIIGGSVIGVEFASVWKSFGADVTIIEGLPTLVPLEDPSLSKQLERAFRKRKINFKTGVKFDSVKQTENGVTVTLEDGTTIDTDLVLVAVGRGPNSAGMGYEEAGITVDRGWVPTNERLATNVDGVFAVGDLVPGLQLAHRGFAHGIFVAEEIAGLNPQPVIDAGIPRVTYCDPEIASVGITEPQAREKFGDDGVETVEYSLGGNGKSQILGTTGSIKLVREKDGPIVGVHMIGARYGEQVGEASLIVNWEAYPEDVAQFIHAHPTQNEALGEAALALAGKPLHSHA
ncbi:dihydrolipoyl dehydrogenase [Aeromicrobium sp. SMF47]|uniref:Dihydrolipoyl dehydrogenase n=1 Tax=Aeromicrobium yanjiei TaxID=2662028 RepID=A0A5Q2MD72_9ACTN|nr:MULTISPECIES: dihydrolipoyl dehydrogenase [Aeromicrobium]MRJ77849.1 dihydrolipoyl dehydrogenase [Aeromicrobium yanjiei]MRK02218.1 dihydrolipoyl dehydrogenase [Aeromicrobium sp. S22]QGG41064.1 dihydrolipoyl dehydrogenase [Aeromicrobium yanjiei]